jgi:hypothetical protein
VQNGHFQRLITMVILVNTTCLALDYHDQVRFAPDFTPDFTPDVHT